MNLNLNKIQYNKFNLKNLCYGENPESMWTYSNHPSMSATSKTQLSHHIIEKHTTILSKNLSKNLYETISNRSTELEIVCKINLSINMLLILVLKYTPPNPFNLEISTVNPTYFTTRHEKKPQLQTSVIIQISNKF